MQWISSLLFGVSSSLDALLIGISLGLRHVRLKYSQNLFISLIALLGRRLPRKFCSDFTGILLYC